MQKAPDCDMVVVHDDDLLMIDGLGCSTVSGLLNGKYDVLLIQAVLGNPQTRHDDGSPPEVQHRDKQSFVW